VALPVDTARIVQSDGRVAIEAHAPRADEARAAPAPFAELVKSPNHVHTYRVTPLSVWNARAAGLAARQMVEALREHARDAVPSNVEEEILGVVPEAPPQARLDAYERHLKYAPARAYWHDFALEGYATH
jgi:hypothetical protein